MQKVCSTTLRSQKIISNWSNYKILRNGESELIHSHFFEEKQNEICLKKETKKNCNKFTF